LALPNLQTSATKTSLVYGYSAGVGVDVMLMASLFLRAEYEYQRVTSKIDSTINTARVGLGYKF
jgi:opacity protein-like surface antigen